LLSRHDLRKVEVPSSIVFRDMFRQDTEGVQKGTLTLDDPSIEDEAHLRLFLLLLEHRPADWKAILTIEHDDEEDNAEDDDKDNDKDYSAARDPPAISLAKLIAKYDCPYPRDVLRPHMRLSHDAADSAQCYTVFKAAALINDAELCRDVLAHAAKHVWPGDVGDGLQLCAQAVPGASALDVSALAEKERLSFPVRYVTALLRAGRLRGAQDGANGDWLAVTKEFYRQVTAKSNDSGGGSSAAVKPVAPTRKKFAEGFDDATADFEIVSSDNAVFRLHSRNLAVHRWVAQHCAACCTGLLSQRSQDLSLTMSAPFSGT
jgi:hypothetical protein